MIFGLHLFIPPSITCFATIALSYNIEDFLTGLDYKNRLRSTSNYINKIFFKLIKEKIGLILTYLFLTTG